MLEMEDYEIVRRKIKIEGKSQRQVHRELGYSRKFIRKALAHIGQPEYRRVQPVKRPVLGPFEAIIKAWLEQDCSAPKKQRHTANRIYQRLCCEHDFKGSLSAVERYVKACRQGDGEVFFPLEFNPGEEAQVDWGEVWIILNGQEKKVYLFCMRLCHSGACFVRAYPNMKMEAFLDGHVSAFNYFGGVSKRLAYDNLKAAVISVDKGRNRCLNKKFMEIKSHFLFESRFCNIAKGNEKGHVENLVRLAQRRFLTPLPEVATIDDLNIQLERLCRLDLERLASDSEKTRGELLQEERQNFLDLPGVPFEPCVQVTAIATKQALVHFDTNRYSVPVKYAYRKTLVKAFVEKIELWQNQEKIATHARSYEKKGFVLNPYHYLRLLETKPGGLLNGRCFKGEPFGTDFDRLRFELEFRYQWQGTKKFIQVLLLFEKYEETKVKAAVRLCVRRRIFSDEAIKNTLDYKPPVLIGSLDLSKRPELVTTCVCVRPASDYDKTFLNQEVLV